MQDRISRAAINALIELARASTPQIARVRLESIHGELGGEADVYAPLLESLVQRAYEVDELRRLAGCDALTGIANRRSFEQTFERELARSDRTPGSSLSVVLLDLDGLKFINDSLGHASGDDALCILATEVSQRLRASDSLARLGGDEFVVVLPDADLSVAQDVAARLRVAVESHQVGGVPLKVSLGVASTSEGGREAEALLAQADSRLYVNKRARQSELPARQGARTALTPAITPALSAPAAGASGGMDRPFAS